MLLLKETFFIDREKKAQIIFFVHLLSASMLILWIINEQKAFYRLGAFFGGARKQPRSFHAIY